MTGEDRGVRVETHDPKLVPDMPWYIRRLMRQGRFGGRLEFMLDGLWFTSDFQRVRPTGRRLVVDWGDVLAVDFRPGITRSPLGLYCRDRSYRFIGFVAKDAAERLRTVGFEPHSKPSWPDRRLWTRHGDRPDWDLLLASDS